MPKFVECAGNFSFTQTLNEDGETHVRVIDVELEKIYDRVFPEAIRIYEDGELLREIIITDSM